MRQMRRISVGRQTGALLCLTGLRVWVLGLRARCLNGPPIKVMTVWSANSITVAPGVTVHCFTIAPLGTHIIE